MKIKDLIEKSRVSRRTVYYYIQLGLLPPPKGRGKNFEYSEEHLKRLQLIKKLQKYHLPLEEIKKLFLRYQPEEIEEKIEYGMKLTPVRALYVHKLYEMKRVKRPEKWVRLEVGDGIEVHLRLPPTAEAMSLLKEKFGMDLENFLKTERSEE